jgi:hypothetical protein
MPHKLDGQLIVLLHQSEVQCRTIPHLIIRIIQTSPQQDLHTPLHLRILLTNTKLA